VSKAPDGSLGLLEQSRLRLTRLLNSVDPMKTFDDLGLSALSPSDHFQDKKIPIDESLVTQCCTCVGMVVLIQ
jgi:hypothetical protein